MPKLPTITKPENLLAAHLHDHDGDISKRWYIDITLRDSVSGDLIRKRISKKINQYPLAAQRVEFATKYIQTLSKMMATGYHFTRKSKFDSLDVQEQKLNPEKITLQQAFETFIVYKQKSDKKTIARYRATQRYLAEFEARHRPILLAKVEGPHIEAILKHFQTVRNISPKTYNHYRSVFFAVCNHFLKLGIIHRNPVSMVDPQRVQKGKKHLPLTLEEMGKLKAHAEKLGDNQFILFMSLCFYGLIRPGKELRLMRVSDIGTTHIWVTAENAKTDEGRRIEMVTALRKIVELHNLQQYRPTDYLFTQLGHPGPDPVGPGYFYKKQKRFLKAVGLSDKGHDLYCYKHSGAIQMIKSGFTAFEVKEMAGHKSVQQTMDYLYNIGAISRLGDKVNNMPDF